VIGCVTQRAQRLALASSIGSSNERFQHIFRDRPAVRSRPLPLLSPAGAQAFMLVFGHLCGIHTAGLRLEFLVSDCRSKIET
jgi:hypothetical protein